MLNEAELDKVLAEALTAPGINIYDTIDSLDTKYFDEVAKDLVTENVAWEGDDNGPSYPAFYGAKNPWFAIPKQALDNVCMQMTGEPFNPEHSDVIEESGAGQVVVHNPNSRHSQTGEVNYRWKIGQIKPISPDLYAFELLID